MTAAHLCAREKGGGIIRHSGHTVATSVISNIIVVLTSVALPPAAQTRTRLNLSDWSRTISASKSRCRAPHGRQSGRGGGSAPTLRTQCYHPVSVCHRLRSAQRHRPADLLAGAISANYARGMQLPYGAQGGALLPHIAGPGSGRADARERRSVSAVLLDSERSPPSSEYIFTVCGCAALSRTSARSGGIDSHTGVSWAVLCVSLPSDAGVNGTYLVRASETKTDSMVLSVGYGHIVPPRPQPTNHCLQPTIVINHHASAHSRWHKVT